MSRSVFVTISVLLLCSPWTYAQAAKSAAPHPQPQDYEQYVTYWTAEPGWRTELQLRNNLDPAELTVTPVLRTADGAETAISPATIKSGDVVSLDLSEAVMKDAPQLAGAYGSMVLRYRAAVPRALYAAVMVRVDGHPIAFHIDATFRSSDPSKASREGIWWLPQDSVSDYLILSNSADSKLDATLTLYDASGKAWQQKLSLGARQMQRFSVRSLVQKAGLLGSYGGIKIEAAGGTWSLGSAHFLFDELGGFGAIMKMFDHDPATTPFSRSFGGVKGWTTRAPMLALTDPDPALGLPAGTALQPKVLLRNTSNRSYTAHIHFNWRSATATGESAPVDLVLQPNATQMVDVTALQAQKLIPADAHWAAVILSAAIQPDDLMAVASSYDQTGRYGAQTPFSDQLAFHWEAGQWEVDSMHNSLVTIGNGGNQPVRAELTIFYNHGSEQYQMEQTLAPDEQMLVDFGRLIRDRVPDKAGHLLPADLTSGAYRVRDLTNKTVGSLYEGKVIVEKTYGHAAYGCAVCCGYTGAGFNPVGFDGPVGIDSPQDVTSFDACSDQLVDITGDMYGWASSNTSVATLPNPTLHTVGPGTATGSAEVTLQIFSIKENCPLQTRQPTEPVTVVQVQIASADIESNQVSVTLSGPSGTSGTLEVIAIGTNNQPQVTYNGGAAVGPGSYNVAFNRPQMPADTYSSVKAIWNYDTIPATSVLSLSRKWIVVGTIRHSQYNTIYESTCSAATQTAYLYSSGSCLANCSPSSCTWQAQTLRSGFVSQTELNGSGRSINYGWLKYDDGRCKSSYPSGANTSNSLLQVSSITGQCGTTLVGGDSVATNPGPYYSNPYACGDNLELVNGSNQNAYLKHVEDQCANTAQGCADGHMDDYSAAQQCSGVTDLPGSPYWTVDDQ